MGILYHIDKEKGISFTLWDGVVTADEFLVHVQRMTSDPDWPGHRGLHIGDLRTTTLDKSIDQFVLERAASLFGKHPKISNVKTAILAQDEFKTAVAYERYLRRYRSSLIVFNALETACIWLGIDVKIAALTLRSLRARLQN